MIDWDAYRAAYDSLTKAEQVAFYDRVWELHPVQHHYDARACTAFLDRTGPSLVVEYGGWRGELAAEMLARFPAILAWRNVEICRPAARATVCSDPRYRVRGPLPRGAALVASHVIEHMRLDELAAILDRLAPAAAYVAAPLTETGQDWAGYVGSHVLREGWAAVVALFEARGLIHQPGLDAPDVRCFITRRA